MKLQRITIYGQLRSKSEQLTVFLPVERDEDAALLIAVSPEIGKKLLQLRKSLHIAALNGIADDGNLNDV